MSNWSSYKDQQVLTENFRKWTEARDWSRWTAPWKGGGSPEEAEEKGTINRTDLVGVANFIIKKAGLTKADDRQAVADDLESMVIDAGHEILQEQEVDGGVAFTGVERGIEFSPSPEGALMLAIARIANISDLRQAAKLLVRTGFSQKSVSDQLGSYAADLFAGSDDDAPDVDAKEAPPEELTAVVPAGTEIDPGEESGVKPYVVPKELEIDPTGDSSSWDVPMGPPVDLNVSGPPEEEEEEPRIHGAGMASLVAPGIIYNEKMQKVLKAIRPAHRRKYREHDFEDDLRDFVRVIKYIKDDKEFKVPEAAPRPFDTSGLSDRRREDYDPDAEDLVASMVAEGVSAAHQDRSQSLATKLDSMPGYEYERNEFGAFLRILKTFAADNDDAILNLFKRFTRRIYDNLLTAHTGKHSDEREIDSARKPPLSEEKLNESKQLDRWKLLAGIK